MPRSNDDRTIDMFLIPQAERPDPATSDYSVAVATQLKIVLDSAQDHDLDRFDVAAEMSRLVGKEITKTTIDKWAAPSSTDHNIYFCYIPVLESICSSTGLTDWLVKKRGGRVAYGKDTLNVLLSKKAQQRKKLDAEMKQLEKMIGASE